MINEYTQSNVLMFLMWLMMLL